MGLDMYLSARRHLTSWNALGLDMYLSARRHLTSWNDDSAQIEQQLKTVFPKMKKYEFTGITVNVAYWRKANAIHKWFVDNVQDGVDECQESYVTMDQIRELKIACESVLKNHDNAPALLPTKSGFFFGGTEYDEDYFADVEWTLTVCNDILDNAESFDGWYLEYQASW